VLVAAEGNFGQLLRKEKDEASPTNHFRQDSLNAFIPRFAGIGGFFIFSLQFRAGLSTKNRSRKNYFLCTKLKDQPC
jgi:hypothetical protein